MMRCLYVIIIAFISQCKLSSDLLLEPQAKLSIPYITVDSIFFFEKSRIYCEHRLDGSIIEEFSEESREFLPIEGESIEVSSSNRYSFRASKLPLFPSDSVTVDVFKINPELIPASIESSVDASPEYAGTTGLKSLIDGKKAELSFLSGEWLGYNQDELTFTVKFEEKQTISEVIISSLHDQNSWIFPPDSIIISHNDIKISQVYAHKVSAKENTSFTFSSLHIPPSEYDQITVTVYRMKALPNWHNGAGNPAWLFLDEILFQ